MACITVYNGYMTYTRGKNSISVAIPKSMIGIQKIKNFDMGYMVFDAIYGKEVEEEYADFSWGLHLLGLDKLKDEYFEGIRSDDICVRKN